jgi:AcrR family transcriptional regulator
VPKAVKRESPNQSVGRGQARTRFARRAVVDAARTLFLERGYVATTIEAISEHADVPPATVYRLFSSKLGILKALLDTSIAGDDQPLAVQQRPDVASLFTESDPDKLLAGLAGVTTAINQRTNDVYRVLMSAAGSDPAAAELLSEIERQRDLGQRQIARSLSRAHALKPGLRERDAADLIHALMSPEVYRLLVGDRGWTPARYEEWLATTLTQQLT